MIFNGIQFVLEYCINYQYFALKGTFWVYFTVLKNQLYVKFQ